MYNQIYFPIIARCVLAKQRVDLLLLSLDICLTPLVEELLENTPDGGNSISRAEILSFLFCETLGKIKPGHYTVKLLAIRYTSMPTRIT